MGLAPCLTYVTGGSKAPTLDCCSGLKQVMDKSTKCLCLLIKDRDEPNLGIKVNISLAATLPNTCHSPANVSDCVSTFIHSFSLIILFPLCFENEINLTVCGK
ncbi:Non-specific lipid transfer protein GPI-anchored 14 [Linum perenne]